MSWHPQEHGWRWAAGGPVLHVLLCPQVIASQVEEMVAVREEEAGQITAGCHKALDGIVERYPNAEADAAPELVSGLAELHKLVSDCPRFRL